MVYALLSKRNQLTLITLCFLMFNIAHATSDWQLWHSESTKGKWGEHGTADLEYHMRFRDNISEFFYYHAQTRFMGKTFKKNFFGVELRAAFEKNSAGKWRYESRPGVLFTNKFNLGKIALDSRFRFYYRLLEGRKNRGAIRIRLGISPYKNTYFSPFLKGEFFYNHNNFQEYDRNRISVGFKSKIGKNISWVLYYLHQENKSSDNGPWSDTHVLGFDLQGKI